MSCKAVTDAGKPCKVRPAGGADLCHLHAAEGNIGRKTLLTPETHKAIVDAVRAGSYLIQAALAAGISETTLYRWLGTGEKERDLEGSIYRAFREDLARARGQAEVAAVAAVRTAMREDWRAAAWYLERGHSDRWRRRDSQEVHVSMEESEVDAEIKKLLAEMDARASGSKNGKANGKVNGKVSA